MNAPRRTYELLPKAPDTLDDALNGYHPIQRQLLFNRGLNDAESIRRFLEPDFESDLHDPFLLTDMEKAATRVLRAVHENEHIVIYTDYDCDGIPGGVLLHDFLTEIGYDNFENYIPHRHDEGYGFNPDAVPAFKERGASLIITVDCGITDHEAVERANDLGIDVIVTDHHEPAETLPPAYAVVNPKRDDAYPFSGICGTAVAWKLVGAVLSIGRKDGTITLKEGMEKWWLDLVGLATVADMVPLQDESRVLARYGLSVLRKSRRPGLQQLLRKAGANQRFLTEDDIGFTIAPRINAASRMDDPEDAFHMLRTRDEADAGARVYHLEKLNNERKGVVGSMVKEAKRRIEELIELPQVIVMGNPEWRPSLVGLVANSLSEEFGRPAFLWGRDGKGIIKGSCRSAGGVSIVRLMELAKDAFITFGGHHASGGFSVSDERIHTLPEALHAAYAEHGSDVLVGDVANAVDAELSLDDIDDRLLRALDALAPYGVGNPKPLFKIRSVMPRAVEVFGKTKNHTKLRLETAHGRIDAISFFALPDSFTKVPKEGETFDLIAHVERSYFMGRLETRLRLVDIV
ncbi:MAG TPA: single-stranded-DNA-specific exonuclease RecJ [Candidatus Paceibacterota bacterium]|nr:single-stranded-DNA-specific exonuclease RecJ [Candidatus Paceibacterota bacterium]